MISAKDEARQSAGNMQKMLDPYAAVQVQRASPAVQQNLERLHDQIDVLGVLIEELGARIQVVSSQEDRPTCENDCEGNPGSSEVSTRVGSASIRIINLQEGVRRLLHELEI